MRIPQTAPFPLSLRLLPSPFRSAAVSAPASVRRKTLTRRTRRRLNFRNPKRRLQLAVCASSAPSTNGGGGTERKASPNGDGLVEVIGIGSRKDAVIDFCLDSPFRSSSSLRFWNLVAKDASNVQLLEKRLDKGSNPRIVNSEQFLQFSPKAVILVASAGYGLDHEITMDILKSIKSRNGFVVAIFVRPFSFEGQRRQDEIKELVLKLQEHTSFCIDIDTDALLKKDLVTLDEALKTANSAVLLAMNAISVLLSEIHPKLYNVQHKDVKGIDVSEAIRILGRYDKAKIGFGVGESIESSISQALYDCPFIGSSLEEFKGIIVCNMASPSSVDRDINSFLDTFRQKSKYTGEIILSTAYEPNMDSSSVVTTVFTVGYSIQTSAQKRSIISRLAQYLPFVFNLFGGQQLESSQDERNTDANDWNTVSINYDEPNDSRIYLSQAEEREVGLPEDSSESSQSYDQMTEEPPPLQRESFNNWSLGPGYQIAQEWAKERAGVTSALDNLCIFSVPVGVKSLGELKDDDLRISPIGKLAKTKSGQNGKKQRTANSNGSSWDTLTDGGFEAVKDLYTSASSLLKGKNVEVPKKQGVLSVRAASMLEAERDTPSKWSPVMEMQYRGGVYKGRCQGGLPEGKGRLTLEDGGIYDGMWRYGKRSGPGAFYFSNGDVFQGFWREDVMHGKGWFYFHTGDRWFANFWKGKASGESRFYSKSGDVFFGQFQDGWRHGDFLCIGVDGARRMETWEEGVLINRKQLDSEAASESIQTSLT